GVAAVVLEERGCGASFGQRRSDPDALVADVCDAVDWIVAQPWSDGTVHSIGFSAPALAAQLLLSAHHPAVRGCIACSTAFDMYAATHPGGLGIESTAGNVGDLMRALDSNQLHKLAPNPALQLVLRGFIRGLRPVDSDPERAQLAAACREHATNDSIDVGIIASECRDDPLSGTELETTLDAQSASARPDALASSGALVSACAGWWEAGFAAEAIKLHQITGGRLVLGPWPHALTIQADGMTKR